jgi:mycothiol synthase
VVTAAGSGPVVRRNGLEPDEFREVLALTGAAADADGAAPLSEHVLLRLRGGSARPGHHFLIPGGDGRLLGYGHLDPAGGMDAELVVHPSHRRRGLGRALAEEIRRAAAGLPSTGGTAVRFWSHGDHPSAAAVAVDLGLDRVRVLWQLRRSLTLPLPDPHLPAGVTLRPFRPGADDRDWLAVNRRAFAGHPEQGRWGEDDLRVRQAEPWFDPAGFLLAVEEAGGQLLGFHWTKVHPEPGRPIGEVYVLGVDPGAHGLGLGRALTVAGLAHLRGRGLTRVMLYVDETNTAAVRLYRQLGFAHWSAHVQYGVR